MLLRQDERDRIARGAQSVVFRRWVHPSVRAGGTLKTPSGVVGIDAVEAIDERELGDADARAAGYGSRVALLAELAERDGQLYRIRVHHAGEDPRVALRERADLGEPEIAELAEKLAGLDRRSRTGPWTTRVLELIAARPATLAAQLAKQIGQETPAFKRDVRKLKELGLTESLEVGYRLSPRGRAWLVVLERGRL
jgi:hypothetical protein